MNPTSVNTIHEKVDSFIQRFYQREVLKGLIITLSGLTGLFTLFIICEFVFRFSGNLRAILFYSFLSILLIALTKNVLLPLGKKLGFLSRINRLEAAALIGNHFPEVGDKLTNTLQLQNENSSELALASIHQKIDKIAPFNFKEAVSFTNLTKVSRWAIIPILFVAIIGGINPSILKNGTERIINYSEDFTPENPFKFELVNQDLKVVRNQNYTLKLKFTGDQVPKETYIDKNGQLLRLKKVKQNEYVFEFRNVQGDINFKIKTDEYYSNSLNLKLIEKPVLSNISIAAKYPKYTSKENETHTKSGDLTVPEGTHLKWEIRTKESSEVTVAFSDTTLKLDAKNDFISFNKQIINSSKYILTASNKNLKNGKPLAYSITVVKDAFPEIKVQNFPDSINPLMLYHSGLVSDDYGISKLIFRFSTKDTTGSVLIPILKNKTQQSFNHSINLSHLNIKKGDELSYYFETFDNDGINGSKSAKSMTRAYKLPSEDEIEELLAQNNENIKDQLDQNLKKAKELQNEFDEIRKMMLEKQKMDWSDKARVEQFLENQKSFEEDIKKLNFENQKNNFQKEHLSPEEEKILQKQEQINDLFEQLMDEETKKLYEELEKLMEELNQDETKDVLEQIDLSNEELEKELDRTLELFKQMEFDQKLETSIDKLKDLAKKQEELAKETKENKELTQEELQNKQEELSEDFKDVQEDIKDLKQKNEELENKRPLDEMKEQQEAIQENQEKSKEEISNNKRKKSSKSQQKAAEQMQQMAQQMEQMQQQMQEQHQMEDINSLRQILENLISLSVDQEELMQTFKRTSRFDPQFPLLAKKQGDLKESAKIIEDSLLALSKRQVALQSIINREILEINYNMNKSIDYLRERNSSAATLNQQFIMTSSNNLALILDESLQQMQQQMMNQQQSGSGSCNKPGGKPKPGAGMKNAKQMQKMLNKQIQQMKKEMQDGNKKGKSGKKGKGGMAKRLAQMAAQQNAIKEQLRKLNEDQKKQGKGGVGELENLQQEMDKTERDILNKNITRETIERQQKIMTKLLEAEKALREREFDDKRESKKGKKQFKRNPEEFSPYKSFELEEKEQLKSVPASFNLYYKRKINEYFNTFEE